MASARPLLTLTDINCTRRARRCGRCEPLSMHSVEPLRCSVRSVGADMRRREFITFCSGAVAAWPFAASAQQPTLPTVGWLHGATPDAYASMATAFRKGLNESGYVETQNVKIEYRWAEGRLERLPELAA